MPHRTLALLLTAAIAAINLGELAWFSDGYLPRQIAAIALWAGLPAPVAYLLGARPIRRGAPARILCGGLLLALAIGLFGAWDIFYGAGAIAESLSIVIFAAAPAYQNAVIAASLLLAWIVEWRLRSSASQI